MKKIACLLCLLGLAFIMFLAVGCESLTGPEGKYVHRDSSRMDVYALVFEKKKVTIYNLGKERLKELYLPLPPMAEQSRIVGKINEVLSSIMSR